MHPQILKDEPGKCPLCGMNLIPLGGTARPEKDEHSIIIRIMIITQNLIVQRRDLTNMQVIILRIS